jgi:copper chaperone CopZ
MKIILKIIFLFFLSSKFAIAQTDTVRIKTSAQCDDCKERIEKYLSFEKGIKSSALDVDTKVITVVYNSEKTNTDKIREAITKVGYDADSLSADEKGYKRLPKCCQKEGDVHQE